MPTNNAWNSQNPAQVALGGTGAATLTSHGVLLGQGTSAVTATAAGTSGQILQSGGAAADPTYSTSTYPATNAINTLLYASSANVMSALATANSGVLTTSSSGVPAIDTTNFAVLSTGVQMKGNNANTAPPAGFIGEEIKSVVASGAHISLANATAKTMTSVNLTAGVWDVSLLMQFDSAATCTVQRASISTTNNTEGTFGDNMISAAWTSMSAQDVGLVVPAYRLVLSTTTTVYAVALCSFTPGTCNCYGRLKAVRVG